MRGALQFLCNGLKDDMTLQWAAAHSAAADKTQRQREIENYTRASGKMLLLHKLLPKLRAEGRQVSDHDCILRLRCCCVGHQLNCSTNLASERQPVHMQIQVPASAHARQQRTRCLLCVLCWGLVCVMPLLLQRVVPGGVHD